ncbi:MAG: amidohydrolase [Oscillospiraceae bacterium]|jgi:imidazolonepropionase-like amidohydrolase|nr:amidohydrolase [Oscillospiraceae bacterium]
MVIYNARIKTMVTADIENGFVEFYNGKITAAAPGVPPVVSKTDIDAKGLTLCPGFIDAHSHLGVFENGLGFEGTDANEITDPAMPHLRAIDMINPRDFSFTEAAKAGVTCAVTGVGSANPMGGELLALKTAGSQRIDKLIVKSPMALKFALGENPKTCYNDRDETPTTRMAVAAVIREQLYKAKRYMEQIEKHKKSKGETDLPEYDIKNEALLPLLRREINAHIHCHRADDIFTAIRLAKEFNLGYVIVHATEGGIIAGELKEEGARCIIGPIICERSKPELANLRIDTAAKLHAAGVSVAICTDHPVTPIQYLPLTAGLAVKGGLPEEEALRAITINAAKICKIDERVGSIEVGKDADFVLFEGKFYDFMKEPKLVVIDGKVI